MADQSFDLVVIGSGPGGYVSAIRAAQVGLKTAVVEKQFIGGRCLNVACIPAKAVLRSADVLAEIQEAEEFGITVGAPTVDFGKVNERRKSVISTLTGGVAGLLKKNGVEVFEASANSPRTATSRSRASARSRPPRACSSRPAPCVARSPASRTASGSSAPKSLAARGDPRDARRGRLRRLRQ